MASCPCCGNSLPSSAESNELCPACSHAMDTGSDGAPRSHELRERDFSNASSPQTQETLLPRQRPLVVKALAILSWVSSGWALLLGIVFLVAPRVMHAVFRALDPSGWDPGSEIDHLGYRLLISGFAIFCALAEYCIARGLWRLRNWARCLMIAYCAIDLFPSRAINSSTLWPLSLWVRGPLFELISLSASFALILYLLSPQARSSFRVSGGGRGLQFVVGVLALAAIGISLSKSGPEYNAAVWHLRHGNRISVNGTTFPVYSWYAPVQYGTGFRIWDEPGPLRGKDGYTSIDVSNCKESESATVEQLVDIKVRDLEESQFTNLSRFQMQVGKQPLTCVQRNGSFSIIYCYGDGPIASIHFSGNEVALQRFRTMMAEAR